MTLPCVEDPLAVLEESPHLSQDQMDGDMVQEQQPQQPDVFLVEPPERDLLPPRRIHGKKNPDQLHPHYRSVRVLRHGGEWYGTRVMHGVLIKDTTVLKQCCNKEPRGNATLWKLHSTGPSSSSGTTSFWRWSWKMRMELTQCYKFESNVKRRKGD